MKKKKLLLIFLIFISFVMLFIFWYSSYIDNKVDVLAKANRVKVIGSQHHTLKFIEDKNIIETLTTYLSRHNGGWQNIISYYPTVDIVLIFYKDGKNLGDFGMGRNYVTIANSVYFKEVPISEIDEIYNIIQVTKES